MTLTSFLVGGDRDRREGTRGKKGGHKKPAGRQRQGKSTKPALEMRKLWVVHFSTLAGIYVRKNKFIVSGGNTGRKR